MRGLLKIVTSRVTSDPEHPWPWRWFYTVDTPLGVFTDEGLSNSEKDAVADAALHFRESVKDKFEQNRTRSTHDYVFNVDTESEEVTAYPVEASNV